MIVIGAIINSYENAYISLSIEDFISVILFPSLLTYDPLELQEENAFHSIRDLPWFQSFSNFCETVVFSFYDLNILLPILLFFLKFNFSSSINHYSIT